MAHMNSVRIVEEFWARCGKAHDPEAVDLFLVDDFILTTGRVDVVSRERFKHWVKQFLEFEAPQPENRLGNED